jgi:NAD(P)-dependent dehydrogenase (short-subunit alcohol dehydrogenase family)
VRRPTRASRRSSCYPTCHRLAFGCNPVRVQRANKKHRTQLCRACSQRRAFDRRADGFSKACLGAYCQVLARQERSLLCTTCSPGWVKTEMSSTYTGDASLRSIDEGGEVPAWLACGARSEITCAGFYMPDRSVVSWAAD